MEENRFKRLRYHDKECFHQKISMTKLAEKMEISKATISKLEAQNDYDARISIIKKYKEQFPEISYDYLLGATNTRYKQYNVIEEKLPFENEFYNNLEKLLATTEIPSDDIFYAPHDLWTGENLSKKEMEVLFNALINDGDAFHTLLLRTFKFMCDLCTLEYFSHNANASFTYKTAAECKNSVNFGISQAYLDFVHNTLYPSLIPYLKKSIEESIEAERKREEEIYKNFPDEAPF